MASSLRSTPAATAITARSAPVRTPARAAAPAPRRGGAGAHAPLAGAALGLAAALGVALAPPAAHARLEGVNKPELLPEGPTRTVLDVAGYLTEGEETRLSREIENLEVDTGLKLRVLAQNYPDTPGLAIRDYWGVDDDTIVFVADPTLGKGGGNIININVGSDVDLYVPGRFWTQLQGKYGTKFYWTEAGEEASIVNAVSAIDTCLREPEGPKKCTTVQGEFDEDVAPKEKKGIFGLF